MNGNRKNDPRSLLMIVSAMLLFGPIAVYRRSIPLPSAFLAFVRGIVGGAAILLFRKIRGKSGGAPLTRRQFVWLAVSGAAMGFNWMLLFEAYNHTTVAIATLCYYMEPTIVMLLSPFIFRERLTAKKAVCAAVAVVGMILVSGVLSGGGGGNLTGVFLALGAAALYASVVIMSKLIRGVDGYRKASVQLLAAGLVMAPYSLLSGGAGGSVPAPLTLVLLFFVCVLHTGLPYLLYFGSTDGLRAQTIALLSYIDPVAALFFAAVLLHEPLSAPGIIGAVLIIGSAVAAEIGEA